MTNDEIRMTKKFPRDETGKYPSIEGFPVAADVRRRISERDAILDGAVSIDLEAE